MKKPTLFMSSLAAIALSLPIPALDFLDPGADTISSGDIVPVVGGCGCDDDDEGCGGGAAAPPVTAVELPDKSLRDWRAICRQLAQSTVHTFLKGDVPKNLRSDEPE